MTVRLIATLVSKPEFENEVKNKLKSIVELTKSEKGCLDYQLNYDDSNSARFIFLEEWETREDLNNHLCSDHLIDLKEYSEEALLDFSIVEIKKVK